MHRFVLAHGFTQSARSWATFQRLLVARLHGATTIAVDLPGHGDAEPPADVDLWTSADLLADRGGPGVYVGYSMGGPIAQLVWRRHAERVTGLVLCATAPYFAGRRNERRMLLGLTGLATMARVAPEPAKIWLTEQLYLQRKTMQWEPWAIQQAATHDWRMVLEAGRAIGHFSSSDWLHEVDVPVSTVLTMRDQVVPLRRQVKLFELIPDAEAFRVDGLHDAAVASADRFVPTLIRAIDSVVRRS